MSDNEKDSLKVEGLGENTVPEVKGMKKEGVDVTAMPSVSLPLWKDCPCHCLRL